MRIGSVSCWSISCALLSLINSGLGDQHYFLKKSGGYSREGRGLIPFPRTGRSTNTWLVPVTEDDDDAVATPTSNIQTTTTMQHPTTQHQQHVKQQILQQQQQDQNKQRIISKRSIPETTAFNRRLLRSSEDTYARRLLRSPSPTQSYYRRLTRSGNSAFSRRLLRGDDTYARRLLRSSDDAYARRLIRSQDVFNRRLIRSSEPSAFYRRLMRSPTDAYKRRIFKKASLIPFPRTGKRTTINPGEDEESVPVYQTMASFGPGQDQDQDEMDNLEATLPSLEDLDEEAYHLDQDY